MSEQKDKYFQRQHNRFMKAPPRKDIYQSAQVKQSSSQSEPKQETMTQSFVIKQTEPITQEKTPFSLASNAQDNLKRLIACQKTDFENLIRDKILRQDLKKQQRRLTKARNDNKLTVETDTELSITAINGIIGLVEEYINDVNKQKAEKVPPKSTLRANQEKEIARQLKTIDQQIQLNNFASVKSTIQILLKKFGKDELLQEKLGYLNFILALNEEYEREANLFKDLNLYVEKLSTIDIAPENINQSSLALKNLKKQTTIALNKENKKQEPNERNVNMLNQVDRIGGLLSTYIESKTQKKTVDVKTKREIQLEKQLQQKSKSSQFLEQSARFCRDLLEKTIESREELYKQLQTLKKNKKKAAEVPYSMILRIYESITSQKRELNEINVYLKACSQFYIRKNLNAQNLGLQLKKIDDKYASNQTLMAIKPNFDILINNVQQRERFSKQTSAIELELKKVKADNIRLEKIIQEKSKFTEAPAEIEKIDKKKQLEEKRARDAERLKQQKQQKQIERSLENIFNNLTQKKWKIAKNALNIFNKKYEESTSIIAIRSLQSLNIISAMMQDIQNAEARAIETEKREKTSIGNLEKQKQVLTQKLKSSDQYENIIKNLIQNFNQEGFNIKKYFDDLRKDRKKIVQQKYQLINKLEDPIIAFKQAKFPEVSEKISLSLSSSLDNELDKVKKEKEELSGLLQKQKQKTTQLESRLKQSAKNPQINKDAEELLSLVKKIEKGGQWWKFLPKNLKNSTFKHIYNILEKYRQNELTIQSLQMFMVNEELLKEEANTLNNALDSCLTFIKSNTDELFSESFWDKKLLEFKGNQNCDKLIVCLNELTGKAKIKVDQERNYYKDAIATYQQEIQSLSIAINDLEKRKDTHTQKSSSKLEESAAKKSPELKSSRKTSRSKEKEREGQVKEAIQEYVQQERKMLSKIEQLEGDKQNLEIKAAAIENELIRTERKLEDQKIDFENSRFAAQKLRLKQLQRINQLEGQLQISEGRRIELQTKLQSQINSFAELERQLTSKLQYFQSKQTEHDEAAKSKEKPASSQIENRRLTQELNYYRQMYGQLSKELQNSKEKEQRILNDFESLKKSNEILQKKYHAQTQVLKSVSQSKSSEHHVLSDEASSPLKMKPYRVDLNTEKIFDLYLDSQRIQPKQNKKQEVAQEKAPEINFNQIAHLRSQIQKLQIHIRNLETQKSMEIEREVLTALKNQQSDFNEFLKRFEAEKFDFFMNQILPKRLQEELVLRNLSNNSNYEFLHNEWIMNEFPRLYEERHSRQCSNSNILDIQAQISNRLQAAKADALREKRREWEEETNRKIQQSLLQYSQEVIPRIIQQNHELWEEAKAKQWEIKVWQIEQYWRKALQQQKNTLTANSLEAPLQSSNTKPQPQKVLIEPSELQLLEIMRRQSSKMVLDTLFAQQLSVWQQKKANDWIAQRNDIESYWQTVILPEKLQQWQAQKDKEIANLKIIWLEQNNRQWNIRLNEVIIPQKLKQLEQNNQKLLPQTINISSIPPDISFEIIQTWKNANLPAIIEAQRKYTIEQFIQIDLPIILAEERNSWLKLQQIPDVDQILIDEHKKWQQEKQKQIGFITSSFDVKINEILQLEHAEWERLKIIEIQQILAEEQARWNKNNTPNIEQILQNEHQHWQLVKLEQIRRIELDFETRLNQIQRKLNSQIIDYQEKYLQEQNRMGEVQASAVTRWRNNELPTIIAKERESAISEFKGKELPKIIEEKYKDWESVDFIQLLHAERNHYIIDNITNQKRKQWEAQKQKQKETYEAKISEIRQTYEKELITQREQHQVEKKMVTTTITKDQRTKLQEIAQWERLKHVEIENRIKQVENYWETVILPERQDYWRRQQVVVVDELIKNKITEVQATYQEDFIPKIIEEEWKKWQGQFKQKLEKEKELWLADLPNILRTGKYNHYLQPFIQTQTAQYDLQIKKIQAQSASSNIKIQQLLHQIAEYQSRLRENKSKYEMAESKVNSLINEHDITIKRTIEESQKLNEELARSRWAEKEVEQLRKIIDMQKAQVSQLTTKVRQGERYKLENINLQEAHNNLQKAKWQQINDLRSNYETKILQIATERNTLQSKISQLQVGRKEGSEKEAIQSLQRQISILTSTLKTKDAEIAFLKKTIQTVNAELRENREKFNEELEKRGNSERSLAQMRSARLQLDYEIKYLRDREQSLTKKLELKDQEMVSLRKKIELDNESIEKKLKSSLEYASSYQVKFSEIETLLTMKTKESQTLLVDLDRVRYENQSLNVNLQNISTEVEQLRRQVRDLETQKSNIMLEKDRNIDEVNRLKQTIIHHESELKRSTENINRLTSQISTEKLRFEAQIKRSKEEIVHLQMEVKDAERMKRIQMERASKLERELAEGGRQAEISEIQVLKKINRDVSDLTATNRQLEMKCLLLQNKEKITSSSSEAINSFLLIQKHTDQLLDYLLKEAIVPNLELYHKFIAESRVVLAAGRSQEYFQLWEKLLRDLFQLTIACRSEEIRTQAEELLRLRDEMTDVLERQIEVSEGDQTQLVEDYKQVLNDIKSLVREYMRSGDDEYLRLLCTSLGIAI